MRKKRAVIELNVDGKKSSVMVMVGNEVATYYSPVFNEISDAVQSLNDYKNCVIQFDNVMVEFINQCEKKLRLTLYSKLEENK